MTQFIRIINWERMQHYKDRNPPWIKLHFSLLASEDWVSLDDASRVLAIACMLIASRNEGVVPDNPAYLKRVAYLNRSPNFKPLVECGFLESASDCKQMLADARPETEERQRQIRETEESRTRSRGSRLPTDWKPSEILETWASKERPDLELPVVVAKFGDYWRGVPGSRGVKLDWEATFRNFIRTEKPGSKAKDFDVEAFAKRIEEEDRKHAGV